ncbi:glycoside hydrolase family 27 protein [Dactylosporangium siamense]|uniref:Alpha-galactosidase n=1 Tax=Dactylosporangium siamense TaxID=685454 RepID=A0A919PMV9_9ACTN|nr:glycoside hydrolase family 27 protein [Dactylosporangium siamense]GIG47047.1 alpha-galactosidase [Dactylosporangium siamense]
MTTTPPMGWNSWDCYGTTVTEAEVLANAEFMAAKLLPHGWDTVVVDIQWYEPTARAGGYNDDAPLVLDGHGRPQPVEHRFPSAAGGQGFGPLAGRIHELGLKFGVHIMRGIPRLAVRDNLPVLGTPYGARDVADGTSTCDWNTDNVGLNHDHPGAQAYYDSLLAMFAAWGVDFVKVDDMLGPYHDREIAAFSTALRGCGRDMVLSLSPGRDLSLEHDAHLRANADMWRVSDDLWDRWEDVYDQFDRCARWAHLAGPGSWPDADMLPLGRVGIRAERGVDRDSLLTWDEQRTLMTLWCIARSPLMFGGDLPRSDPRTLELLTNDAVLAVLKRSTGNRQVLREGDLAVWTADGDGGSRYVAVFATGDGPLTGSVALGSLGCPPGTRAVELWTGQDLGALPAELPVDLPAHGSALFRMMGT